MTYRALCFALAAALLPASAKAQNSTRKIRRAPGELAARAGTGVPWRASLEAAQQESRSTGKPVFWYVPTVRRSPMDRKPEIDRYMLGGPFSWGATIRLLSQHFVPVKAAAEGEVAARLGIERGAFIEPGYVVLDAAGAPLLVSQQVTTFHPDAFLMPLRKLARQPKEGEAADGLRPETAAAARAGRWQEVLDRTVEAESAPAAMLPEQLWMRGVAWFRLGRRAQALRTWRALASSRPDHPLAWKAMLEVEGHGPFVRGFEVYSALPRSSDACAPWGGSQAPAGLYDEHELWQRSLRFLVGAADEDGVYRDSTYDFGGTDGLPNVHAAVTCLVGEALLAATARAARGDLAVEPALLARVEARLAQLRDHASRADWLALSDRDEIVWARAYALRFLQAWQRRRGGDGDAVAPGIRRGVAALVALQPETGVWFHEYGNPFAIATALQALHGARAAGIEVPQDNLDKGLKALAFNRSEQGAFSYGQTRPGRKPRASLEAAAGRMPLCELALYLFGASDQARLLAAVESGERYHGLLAEVRKYDDHANRYGYGGFFFWFDMLGRVEAILELQDPSDRRRLASAVRARVLRLPELDGCFVDSHELGRCYGTAMALLCLDALQRAAD